MLSDVSNSELPQRLAQRLHLPLPGRAAQQTMEPELAYGRHFGPPRPDTRPAAVVALMHMHQGQWHIPLMLRPESLSHHAGQISLPGGTVEPGETSEEAALRELEEELGIPRLASLLLGQLSPLYLFGTNFWISAWVAVVRGDLQFAPSAIEVQEILQIPLSHLLNASNRAQHLESRGPIALIAPHFAWQGHHIWGATSMILAELIAIVADSGAIGPKECDADRPG